MIIFFYVVFWGKIKFNSFFKSLVNKMLHSTHITY
jgi:hypothetical protein